MRICILFGSLRNNSNTALLLQPFINELKRFGADVDYITLKDKHIEPCTACWTCQNIFEEPGCPKNDASAKLDCDISIFSLNFLTLKPRFLYNVGILLHLAPLKSYNHIYDNICYLLLQICVIYYYFKKGIKNGKFRSQHLTFIFLLRPL